MSAIGSEVVNFGRNQQQKCLMMLKLIFLFLLLLPNFSHAVVAESLSGRPRVDPVFSKKRDAASKPISLRIAKKVIPNRQKNTRKAGVRPIGSMPKDGLPLGLYLAITGLLLVGLGLLLLVATPSYFSIFLLAAFVVMAFFGGIIGLVLTANGIIKAKKAAPPEKNSRTNNSIALILNAILVGMPFVIWRFLLRNF